MARLAKKEEVYYYLLDIYICDNDDTNQFSALLRILWADGYLKDIDNFNEISNKMEFLKKFDSDFTEKRREIIMRYRNGEFVKYKSLT